jgi:hypothetical protein
MLSLFEGCVFEEMEYSMYRATQVTVVRSAKVPHQPGSSCLVRKLFALAKSAAEYQWLAGPGRILRNPRVEPRSSNRVQMTALPEK